MECLLFGSGKWLACMQPVDGFLNPVDGCVRVAAGSRRSDAAETRVHVVV